MFCNFVQRIINQYGFINVVYADSAEQTLIAGLRASLRKKGLGWVRVENALKTSINDRINALCILIAQRRFFISKDSVTAWYRQSVPPYGTARTR